MHARIDGGDIRFLTRTGWTGPAAMSAPLIKRNERLKRLFEEASGRRYDKGPAPGGGAWLSKDIRLMRR